MTTRQLILGFCVGTQIGCAAGARTSSSQSVQSGDSAGTSYAMRNAYPDSLEQVRLGAFFAEYRERSRELHASGNYLGEMLLLQELAQKFEGSTAVRSLTDQQIGTYASFMGWEGEALRRFDAVDPPEAVAADTAALSELRAQPATDVIVRLARTAQVVFVNEAHHVPRHRAFTTELLQRLRQLGFTWLAAETLAAADSALNRRGHPVRGSGFYSNEPVFGEMLRTAARLGYRLVPYEATGETSQDGRERGQAQNLVDRILREHPDARILVHAGYAHINESGQLAGASPMAVHFRELSGIDPLTVEQTNLTERGDTAFEHPLFAPVLRRFAPRVATALVNSTGQPWSLRPEVHDVTVIHPRTTYRDGRPAWRFAMGARPVREADDLCGDVRPCVVSARHAGESEDAVPADRILLSDHRPPPPLVLRPGAYHLIARDATGRVIGQRDHSVR